MECRTNVCSFMPKWAVLIVAVSTLLDSKVDARGYTYPGYLVSPVVNKICSNECTKWTPKHCWDGYLKRKIWKMVCESYDRKCCPGYEGPNCETECINCEKIKVIDRRFIEIYGKIKTLEDTCSNVTNDGGNRHNDTGGKIIQSNCSCPAGPQGRPGSPGPIGPPGLPGIQGTQGPQGSPGKQGPVGPPGSEGMAGLPGADGARGLSGRNGLKGERGEPGLPGEFGSGRKGADGINGLPGLQGRKGEPGVPGVDGRNGQTGSKGVPGDNGLPGANGVPGRDGQKGLPGRDGPKGEMGDIGAPGWPGREGVDGDIGLPGEIGIPGPQGPAGHPGRPGQKGNSGADGRPGDITKVEESRIIRELVNTIKNLETRLETTNLEVRELRLQCDRITRCEFNCTKDSFKCQCGKCIPLQYKCDGFAQCPDGSDEDDKLCEFECSIKEFKCKSSGRCLPLNRQCNGVNDCPDGSDEGSQCLDISCNEGNVPCRDGTKCVSREERCDGKEDCNDGSDEDGCDCPRGTFTCFSGQCIDVSLKCDDIPHCDDESDEARNICDVSIPCSESQISCDDKSGCIDVAQKCNGIPDCFDGSDEKNCPSLTTTKVTTTPSTTTSSTTTRPSTTTTTTTTTTPTTTTPPTTTTTTSTTTTTPEATTTDEELSEPGSGDLTCEELYSLWQDPEFPGGSPPPLHPDEKMTEALCAFLRTQKLPTMSARRKRHKHDKLSDDEELMMGDDPGRDIDIIEDLTFDETVGEKPNFVEITHVSRSVQGESKGIAVKTSKASRHSGFVLIAGCGFILTLLI